MLEPSPMQKFNSFDEFWPYYLRQHSKPGTRTLHFAGTTIAFIGIAGFLVTGSLSFLLLALIGSYGPAWIGHFFVEHNHPATFEYPLWSLRADVQMYAAWLNGTLQQQVDQAVAANPSEAAVLDDPSARLH